MVAARVVLELVVARREADVLGRGPVDLTLLSASGLQLLHHASAPLANLVGVPRKPIDGALHVVQRRGPVTALHRLLGAARQPVAGGARLVDLEAQPFVLVEQIGPGAVGTVDEHLQPPERVEPVHDQLQGTHGDGLYEQLLSSVLDQLPALVGQRLHRLVEDGDCRVSDLFGVGELRQQVVQHAVENAHAAGALEVALEPVVGGALSAEPLQLLDRCEIEVDLRQDQLLRQLAQPRSRMGDALEKEAQPMSSILQTGDDRAGPPVLAGRGLEDPMGFVEVQPRLRGLELADDDGVPGRGIAQVLQGELEVPLWLAVHGARHGLVGGHAAGRRQGQRLDGGGGPHGVLQQLFGVFVFARSLVGRHGERGAVQQLDEILVQLPAPLQGGRRTGKAGEPRGEARSCVGDPPSQLVRVAAVRGIEPVGALEQPRPAPEQVLQLGVAARGDRFAARGIEQRRGLGDVAALQGAEHGVQLGVRGIVAAVGQRRRDLAHRRPGLRIGGQAGFDQVRQLLGLTPEMPPRAPVLAHGAPDVGGIARGERRAAGEHVVQRRAEGRTRRTRGWARRPHRPREGRSRAFPR